MPHVIVVTRDGQENPIEGKSGHSLMEAIRAAGVGELLAVCGGCCSCATCHVHVDPAFLDKLTPMGADENDLLDGSSNRNETSRLSCQITLRDDIDGLRVTVAVEDQ